VFLKSLTIQKDEEVIREISFRKGINLIVDETTSVTKTTSGNSVGKTTVLRLIDFCLDGDGKNIYTDSEFKNPNVKVKEFLTENNIIITLVLVPDLDDENRNEIIIQRNFLQRSQKIQKINGEDRTKEEFSNTLKELIFKTSSKYPTFKQLKSKNIRDEKNKLVQTIRVLNSYTTSVEYETLHLFWFGIDVDLSKAQLVRKKNLEKRLQDRLRKESSYSQISQSLMIVDKDIETLRRRKNQLNLNDNYQEELRQINTIKSKISTVANRLSYYEIRKDLIEESKEDLEKSISEIDVEKIRALYKKAKALIPNIQRTFEETLNFHNDMIAQKVTFITEGLPELKKKISIEEATLKALLDKERELQVNLDLPDAIDDLEELISELNTLHEKKGTLEEQKRLWETTIKNLQDIDDRLTTINDAIFSKDHLIQQRIGEFNEYFADISSRLDGVQSLLSADKVDDIYKFAITNMHGNPGAGTKKSQMASFDLSYIKFADEHDIRCLHFILQDQIENVHSNQITNLLTEIVDEVNCQYVLPVLRDKLPSKIDVSDLEILSLSATNKLFKV